MSDTIKFWQLEPGPEPDASDEVPLHLVIDPDDGPLCDPTEPIRSTNDPHKVTCDRCRRIWVTGTLEG